MLLCCWLFQNTTPLQHSLDRHLVERRLNKSLQNPMRPSRRDLLQHGLYIDATPRQIQMEVSAPLFIVLACPAARSFLLGNAKYHVLYVLNGAAYSADNPAYWVSHRRYYSALG